MQVLVTLSNSIGNGLGPNFSLISNAGAVTPSLVSRTSLLNGVVIDVPNNATQITCTSVGNCTNSITLIITGIPIPTTTTSTTTIRPTTTTTTFSNGIPSQTTTTSTRTTTTTSTSTSSTTSTTTIKPTTTTTSTSTSTSTSSTTTSTTTVCCNKWSVNILQADLNDATGNTTFANNTVYIKHVNCFEQNTPYLIIPHTTAGLKEVCSCTAPTVVYYKNNVETQATGVKTNLGASTCARPTSFTTTTSTTTSGPLDCFCVKLTNTSSTSLAEYTATDCNGVNADGILQPSQTRYLCLTILDYNNFATIDEMQIYDDDTEYTNCTCMPTTTSTTTIPQTTTSTTTCLCVENRQVNISISGGGTDGNIRGTLCDNSETFIFVEAGVNIITECIKLGSLQNVGNVTITDQLGGTPCC